MVVIKPETLLAGSRGRAGWHDRDFCSAQSLRVRRAQSR
jgi:hypothetical protein